MESIDNINKTVREYLVQDLRKGSKLSIAAASFSIYAYRELREALSQIEEMRFIFTAPTFTTEKAKKSAREFYIPRLERERGICGTEFEVRLRNELTQRALAKECADWLRSKKVVFKSNMTTDNMMGFMNVDETSYMPIMGFTTVDLGCERGNNAYYLVQRTNMRENGAMFLRQFEQLWNDKARLQDVTETVIESIATAYRENAPNFIYFFTLYNIFHEFLENISEDELPNAATGFEQSKIWNMLYNFQKDAARAIIGKLETYNGCILADSVGLGKTFTALAVIKYYENRNKSVLVLCPKKLAANWNTYKANYVNNSLADDRLRYDVLFHTDLSRTRGQSNGIDLARLNWGNYDLVVIDESHNFRNGGEPTFEDEAGVEHVNRYTRLMNEVIRAGIKTKVLMLSATPVNNRFIDLKNQLKLAYEGDAEKINSKLNTHSDIDEIFRQAQKAFNEWSDLPAAERTTDALLNRLDFDFFELLDSVTIARSRKHIERYYDTTDIGKFPTRRAPLSLRPSLTDLAAAPSFKEIAESITKLNLAIYTPSYYIQPSKRGKYQSEREARHGNLSQVGRESGLRRLMGVNLLKRLESSVEAFRLTVGRILGLIEKTLEAIDAYEHHQGSGTVSVTEVEEPDEEFDWDDQNTSALSFGRKTKINLGDMDYVTWKRLLGEDAAILRGLLEAMEQIGPEHDSKLEALRGLIRGKVAHPINGANRKILIFTAFADTANYLYANIAERAKAELKLETAEVTGTIEGRTTLPTIHADLNTILTCFSPRSKERAILMPGRTDEIDILIATDCISEGQNLQDCDYVINYDIHWNPVRIIQRFGRVDRIGSQNESIQLVNFWPDVGLNEYIHLKERVECRMKMGVLTGAGGDNLLDPAEKEELEYRRAQLERLQNEVVDIEDMSSGVSILDLGLNEFRLDLLEYMKQHGAEIEMSPKGLHAVVGATEELPAGVIFILRNVDNSVNIDNRNRIHPYYMVYVQEDGGVFCNHLDPKKLLDTMRLLCRGKSEPEKELCRAFNEETDDGRQMQGISKLLDDAVSSILEAKDEGDIDSLFHAGGTSALRSAISGLDNFELVCFLVVKEGCAGC